MKIFTKRQYLLMILLCCCGILGYGQVTIAIQDFDGGTPTLNFTGGSAATGNGSSPSTPKYVSAVTGREVNNTTTNIVFDAIDVSAYTGISFNVRLAAFSGNSGNGLDGGDDVYVSISTNGGTSYSQELRVTGNNNAKWGFSGTNAGTGSATAVYDGDNSATEFSPAGGGFRTTDGYTFISITNLPNSANLRVRLEFSNNHANEYWVIDDAELTGTLTAVAPEPTNHPANLIVATGTPPTSVIDLVWDDAITGSQLPHAYLIKANTTGTFTDPVDGTDPIIDNDLSDGTALVKVAQGAEFYSFSGLNPSTQYFFKMWPYTNSGTDIDFKTDGTPQEDNATTEAECGITTLGAGSISCDSNTAGDDNDFVTISLSYTGVDVNAVLAITSGGGSEPNTGDDPASVANGTISFAALEGDAWSVTIMGGNCNLSQSGNVPSSECDPPPTVAINEILADPDSDVNGDGVTDVEDDEFIEIYNSGANAADISGWRIEDAIGTRHTFPMGSVIQPNEGIVIFGGGSPAGIPALVQTSSTGALGINNGGDNMKLFDDSNTLIDSYNFGGSTNDVSYARSPDFSGAFVLHTAIASNPVNYSPGRFNVDNTAFPVKITFFKGIVDKQKVKVYWQTATEENNSHFLIQRSTDEGKTFETIGQVEGQGNSNRPVDYEFIDNKPASGLNYYRLQQMDFDGTYEFFGPVGVRFGSQETEVPVIWPVPTSDRLQVQLPAGNDDWVLDVFDLNGRRLLTQTVEEKSINTFIEVHNLPAGSYFLRWRTGNSSGQLRFVKH